jgi:hypothetical protein
MAVPPHQPVVAPQLGDDGYAQPGERLAQHHGVAVRRHPVEHHAGDVDTRIEGGEAVHDSGNGPRHRRGVDHQQDRCAERPSHVGGRRSRTVRRPVEEPHDTLDDQHVAAGGGAGRQWADGLRSAQPRVEVARPVSGGQGVVAGIDEVRTHLRRPHLVPGRPQRGEQPGGDGRLAHPGMGAGDDDPGTQRRHLLIVPADRCRPNVR